LPRANPHHRTTSQVNPNSVVWDERGIERAALVIAKPHGQPYGED
jgi:hypothetical protein